MTEPQAHQSVRDGDQRGREERGMDRDSIFGELLRAQEENHRLRDQIEEQQRRHHFDEYVHQQQQRAKQQQQQQDEQQQQQRQQQQLDESMALVNHAATIIKCATQYLFKGNPPASQTDTAGATTYIRWALGVSAVFDTIGININEPDDMPLEHSKLLYHFLCQACKDSALDIILRVKKCQVRGPDRVDCPSIHA